MLELYETLQLGPDRFPASLAAWLAGEVQAMALDRTLAERTLSWQPRFDLKAGQSTHLSVALQNLRQGPRSITKLAPLALSTIQRFCESSGSGRRIAVRLRRPAFSA